MLSGLSLFGSGSLRTLARRTPQRRRAQRLQKGRRLLMEHLEDRRLLATTPTYVDDNWAFVADNDASNSLTIGDTVRNDNDTIAPGTITKFYGTEAFGSVTTGTYTGSVVLAATTNDAIAGTTVGGIVNVLEGSYNEVLQIANAVTLLGAQHGVDARTGRVGAAESIIDGSGKPGVIHAIASHVVIDGFTLQGDTSVSANSGGYNAAISIYQSPPDVTGFQALNNILQHVPIGIGLTGNLAVIQHNLIRNMDIPGPSGGAGIYADTGLTNALIDNNEFVNTPNASVLLLTSGSNNTISNNSADNSIAILNMTNTQITGNVLMNPLYDGIYVFGGNNGVTISNNEVTDPVHAGSAGAFVGNPYASYGVLPNSNVDITNNILHSTASTYGVFIDTTDGTAYSDPDPLLVKNNALTGIGAGVKNDQVGLVVDSSANFWGSSSLVAVSPRVTGAGVATVDFTPLFDKNESVANQSVVGFQPDFSSLTLHALGGQTASERIAEGVDLLASPGTLNVATGSYNESVDASSKSVTLAAGSSPGQVTVTGLTLGSNDTLPVDLNGTTAGTGYDQWVVNGGVALANATLNVNIGTLNDGDKFIIVSNDGTDPVTDRFTGLAEGAVLTSGNSGWTSSKTARITYIGGDGNDVAVIVDGPAEVTLPAAGGTTALVRTEIPALSGNYYLEVRNTPPTPPGGPETVIDRLPWDSVTGPVTINGSPASDSFVVDFATPLPAGGVIFLGGDEGAAPGDTLTIRGGSAFASLNYNATGPGAGTLQFSGVPLITFDGLEPVTVTSPAATVTVSITDNAAAYDLAVTDAGGGSINVAETTGTLESITFPAPSDQLIVNGNTRANVITFTSLPTFTAALTVDGQGGPDTITLNTALVLGTATVIGHAALTAETINVNQSINTHAPGSAAAGAVSLTGAMTLAASQSIDTDHATGTDGDVTVFSTAGPVTMANASSINSGAGTVTLRAIGAYDIAISTITTTNTLDSAVWIQTTDGAILDSTTPAETPLITAATGGLLLLSSTGAGSADDLDIQVDRLNAVNSTAGDIRVTEVDALDAQNLSNNTPSGGIYVTAGGSLRIYSSGVQATNGANIVLTANGAASDIVLDAPVSSNGGQIAINADHDIRRAAAGAMLASSGGAITLTADADGSNNGTIQVSGDISAGAGQATFSLADADGFMSGSIASASQAIKNGLGTLALSGVNTYAGATTIDAGTLLVDGSTAVGSAVAVNNNTTLGGTGTIQGTVTLNNTALLGAGSPVSGTESLAIGALTLGVTTTLGVQINGTTQGASLSGYDLVSVTGNATLNGAALNVNGSYTPVVGNSFSILTSTGTTSGTFTRPVLGATINDGDTILLNSQPLEVRYNQGGSNVTLNYDTSPVINADELTATPGTVDNQIVIKRNGANIEVYIDNLVTPVLATPLASLGSLTINGQTGNDTLIVDCTGTNPLPSGGLTFDGGSPTSGSPGDALVLEKGTSSGLFNTITHTFANASDGSVSLDPDGLGGAPASTINYTGLEPVSDNLDAVHRIFTFTGGAETITLTDVGGADGNTQIASTLGESVVFANPSGSLTVNAGSGDDIVAVTSLDDAFRAAFTINGDADNDTINVDATLTLGSATSTGNVSLSAETINANQSIATTAGPATAGAVTLTGALTLAAGQSINTDHATGTDANVDVLSISGPITMVDTSAIDSGDGTVRLRAIGAYDILLGTITTTNATDPAVWIQTTDGAILDNTAPETPLITAANGGLLLRSSTGAGSLDPGDLEVQVASLNAANTTAGDIRISEVDSIDVQYLFNSAPAATGGSVYVVAGGTIRVYSAGVQTTNGGDIALQAELDLLVQSTVQTAGGSGGDISLIADATDAGVGGFHLHTSGFVNSAGMATLVGSDLSTTGAVDGVVIDADGASNQVQAVDLIQINTGFGAPFTSDIIVNGRVSSTSGVAIAAVHDVTFAATGDVTANDAIGVAASLGAITMDDGALIDADGATIVMSAQEDILLGGLLTTSASATAVTITSTTGGVFDNGDTHTDIDANNGTVVIQAVIGIGPGNALETRIGTLDAVNSGLSGDIDVAELVTGGDINVQQLAQTNGGATGNIRLITGNGTLTVLGTGSVSTLGSGNITLTANGGGQDVNLNAVVSGQSGDITITADGGSGSRLYGNAPVTSQGGDIALRADRDVYGNGAGDVSSNGGNVEITANWDGTTLGPNFDGTIGFAGDITAGAGRVTLSLGDCNGNLDGNIVSASDVTKNGAGALRLNGASNTYTGTTTINNGTLLVNGTLVGAGGAVTVTGTPSGTLGGNGTINRVVNVNSGGTLDTGDCDPNGTTITCNPQPGHLLVNGNVTLVPGATFRVQLDGLSVGPGADTYDQLQVNGLVNLGGGPLGVPNAGATLDCSVGFPMPVGAEFHIILNDPPDLIDTRFQHPPGVTLQEGDFFDCDGYQMNISYYSFTDDNDLTLSHAGRYDFNANPPVTEPTYEPVNLNPYYGPVYPANSPGWDTLVMAVGRGGSEGSSLPRDLYTPVRLLSDLAFTNTTATFVVDAAALDSYGAPQQYQVVLTSGDYGFEHDASQFTISGDDFATSETGVLSTGLAEFGQLVLGPVTVQELDALNHTGRLQIRMTYAGSKTGWTAVLNGLDIRPVSSVGTITITDLASKPADGLTNDLYNGTGAAVNSLVTVTTTLGTVDPADDVDQYLTGVQVRTDAVGNFAFHILRPSGTGGGAATITAWEVGGRSYGTALQPYTVAAVRSYDFNSPYSPTAASFVGVLPNAVYSTSTGFGWLTPMSGIDRVASSDYLRRDFHLGTTGTFQIQVPPGGGPYSIQVLFGEPSGASEGGTWLPGGGPVIPEGGSAGMVTTATQITVAVDGAPVVVAPSPFYRPLVNDFQVMSFTASDTIGDGILNITFAAAGGSNPYFAIDGLIIGGGSFPLLAAESPVGLTQGSVLTTADLAPIVSEARARWAAFGLTDAQAAVLQQVGFGAADLVAPELAATHRELLFVTVDRDAAGRGWFIDRTPWEDSEYVLGQPPPGVDLLTVVMHEMGHALGYQDLDNSQFAQALMALTLMPEQARRLPTGPLVTGTNPLRANDVNGDGNITPTDVLQLVNQINSLGEPLTPVAAGGSPMFYDVTGDNHLSAWDVLQVVNYLNTPSVALTSAPATGPAFDLLAGTQLPIVAPEIVPPTVAGTSTTATALPAADELVSPAAGTDTRVPVASAEEGENWLAGLAADVHAAQSDELATDAIFQELGMN